MKSSPMPPRKTRIVRKSRITSHKGQPIDRRRKPRSRSEFARIYGSKKRVEFVKSLECVVAGHLYCGITPVMCSVGIENAHTENGGMSRKADAETIVPLCWGHHRTLHAIGAEEFQAKYRVDLTAEAQRIAAAWLAYTEGAE